ncbi:hypothetical protein QQF64_018293 [Cirrhinus molitorella]|uniref:Uncharacterized protein n=1 Tax=Cirrhinus molitorella TaxID=172907 RepID=A0ABR3LFN3_9TELE
MTILYNYMRGALNKTQTQLTYNDEVELICGCLLPERKSSSSLFPFIVTNSDGEAVKPQRRNIGSDTMSGVIPRSKAKGTDICTFNKYYYIIRSDLGCYMKTSDLNKGSDISIFPLHPACQNGDHYIGGYSCFHIIKGNSCRKVTDLSTDSDAKDYSLHRNCRGGDHYFAAHKYFYVIFQEKGILRVTADMNLDSDAKEHTLHPNFRDGLYYWGLQIKPLPRRSRLFSVTAFLLFEALTVEILSLAGHFCSFFILKPASLWGAQFCTVPDLSKNERTAVYSVHPDVLNFLPGGLSVIKGPVIGMWENIKTITNDSNTPVTWQKKVTKKVGYNKEKMTQITRNWKIASSASIESGELARLIAKLQLSFSAEYGGSHVSTENESWNEATEEEEKLTFELKPKESVYLWQYKLGLGQESVLFCRNLTITNEPNPPTEAPLPSAQS